MLWIWVFPFCIIFISLHIQFLFSSLPLTWSLPSTGSAVVGHWPRNQRSHLEYERWPFRFFDFSLWSNWCCIVHLIWIFWNLFQMIEHVEVYQVVSAPRKDLSGLALQTTIFHPIVTCSYPIYLFLCFSFHCNLFCTICNSIDYWKVSYSSNPAGNGVE